jgi:hypothetical protein
MLFFINKRDENLKRKVYWLSGDDAKISVDQLILADGPSSSGKFLLCLKILVLFR